MKLSKRLKTIAHMIPEHKNVIDVGCDHGLLDIYLTDMRDDIRVLGVDVSHISIASAKKNAHFYKASNRVMFEVSDGLDSVSVRDEAIVFSGMGSHTILSILNRVKLNGNPLIIGTQTNVDLLRREIVKKGYFIAEEKAIFDKKWYVIIRFEMGSATYSDLQYILGPFFLQNLEYMEYLYQRERKIVQKRGRKTTLLKQLEKIKKETK